jgi:non-ribosomal peptide synthetase component E (peptide arylation enzyme)
MIWLSASRLECQARLSEGDCTLALISIISAHTGAWSTEEIIMPVFHTRLTPDLVERYTCAGHWGSTTFYEIWHQRATAHPDREAIIDHRQRVTYGELCVRVERTAAALQQCGIGPGDVVTLQLPNWAEFAYVFFACERLGTVANQIGPDFRSREVEYILRFAESRAFVWALTT